MTIDANFMDSSSYTFEIGRESVRSVLFDTTAIKFDGDAYACSSIVFFHFYEVSTPSVWYSSSVGQCGNTVVEGDLNIFTRWYCMGFTGF